MVVYERIECVTGGTHTYEVQNRVYSTTSILINNHMVQPFDSEVIIVISGIKRFIQCWYSAKNVKIRQACIKVAILKFKVCDHIVN